MYEAGKKRENGKQKARIEKRIEEIQNSNSEEDNLELEKCKTELQALLDDRDTEEARKTLAKYNLEGERPTKLFCSLNKKIKNKAQFEVLHVIETDHEGKETE